MHLLTNTHTFCFKVLLTVPPRSNFHWQHFQGNLSEMPCLWGLQHIMAKNQVKMIQRHRWRQFWRKGMDCFLKEKLKSKSCLSEICTLQCGRNNLRGDVLPFSQRDTWIQLFCWIIKEIMFSNIWQYIYWHCYKQNKALVEEIELWKRKRIPKYAAAFFNSYIWNFHAHFLLQSHAFLSSK